MLVRCDSPTDPVDISQNTLILLTLTNFSCKNYCWGKDQQTMQCCDSEIRDQVAKFKLVAKLLSEIGLKFWWFYIAKCFEGRKLKFLTQFYRIILESPANKAWQSLVTIGQETFEIRRGVKRR